MRNNLENAKLFQQKTEVVRNEVARLLMEGVKFLKKEFIKMKIMNLIWMNWSENHHFKKQKSRPTTSGEIINIFVCTFYYYTQVNVRDADVRVRGKKQTILRNNK